VSAEEVSRAMRGDHDAFAALINASVGGLYVLATLILRDSDRAQDATQEAIVKAWRGLPRLRDPELFQAWLRKMVVNACYDEGRRVRRRAEISLVHLADRHVADTTNAFAESDRLERAFRRLPLDQRTALVLQHKFGLSHVEIADTLGVPLGTVKSRLRYGIAALRASLEADDRSASASTGERTA
jgi:RNA polymerase sigma-70 factor, ECF subfamily